MAVVTDVRTAQARSRQREILLDGEPFRTTSSDAVHALGLRAGTVVSAEDLAARLDACEPRLARERALRLLGYRDRSAVDLRARLLADGYPDELVTDIVADLRRESRGVPARFAASVSRTLTQVRRLGRSRAVKELVASGIAEQVAADAVDSSLTPEAEEEAARVLARALARRPHADPRRIVTRLVRRGYPVALAIRLAGESLSEASGGFEYSDLPVSDD